MNFCVTSYYYLLHSTIDAPARRNALPLVNCNPVNQRCSLTSMLNLGLWKSSKELKRFSRNTSLIHCKLGYCLWPSCTPHILIIELRLQPCKSLSTFIIITLPALLLVTYQGWWIGSYLLDGVAPAKWIAILNWILPTTLLSHLTFIFENERVSILLSVSNWLRHAGTTKVLGCHSQSREFSCL